VVSLTAEVRFPACYGYWHLSKRGRAQQSTYPSIHILDDNSLLHVFYLYRPFFPSKYDSEDFDIRLSGMTSERWVRRWWYKLRMSAEDGGMSYSGPHLTWMFPLSVQAARPLQTCWHIPSFICVIGHRHVTDGRVTQVRGNVPACLQRACRLVQTRETSSKMRTRVRHSAIFGRHAQAYTTNA